MARLTVLCLLAAVCCAAIGAAADPKLMVSDMLVSSKSTKAKTSSYYDDNTELSCLAQLNFKNCRYTGCPVDRNFVSDDTCNDDGAGEVCQQCAPDSIYFQTDFSCCPKEPHYGYYSEGEHGDFTGLAFNDKVGTCDWEISMYRADALGADSDPSIDGSEADPWKPHFTDDGTAIKFGTAWGTCYLNGEAEHCDHPLCERMAINIQGGLYATCAYSTDKTTTRAPAQDQCIANTAATSWNEFNLAYVFTTLQTIATNRLGSICNAGGARRRLQSDNSAQDSYGSHTETYYPGIALVLSGPMAVTAKKDHRFEETGMFQQTISFTSPATDGITDLTNRWPIVAPRGTKARFTRRPEGYYQGGSQ